MPKGRRPRRGSRLQMSGSRRPSAGPRACRPRPGASIPHNRFQMHPSPARGSTTAGRTRAGGLLAHGRSAGELRRPSSPQGHMCPVQRAVSRCIAHSRAHVIACTQGGALDARCNVTLAHRHHCEQHSSPPPSFAVSSTDCAPPSFTVSSKILFYPPSTHCPPCPVWLLVCRSVAVPRTWRPRILLVGAAPADKARLPEQGIKPNAYAEGAAGSSSVHKHHACSRLAGTVAGAGHSVVFITFCRTVGAFTRMPFPVPGLLETEAPSASDKPSHAHRQSRPA